MARSSQRRAGEIVVRGEHDLVPPSHVTLYHAEGCHLCDRAIDVVREAQGRMPFDLELVDIGGVESLEAEYRELPARDRDRRRPGVHVLRHRRRVCSTAFAATVPRRARAGRAGNM